TSSCTERWLPSTAESRRACFGKEKSRMPRSKWALRIALPLLLIAVCMANGELSPAAEPGTEPAGGAKAPVSGVFLDPSQAFALRMGNSRLSQKHFTRELFRQAVLLAAREELGLRTRDSSLGELPRGSADEARLEFAGSPGQKNLLELLRGASAGK